MAHTNIIAVGDGDDGLSSRPEAALPATMLAEPISGVVHDLGNLIQVAASALNIISRNPSAGAGTSLEPVVAGARNSLQRAGLLVQQTMRQARGDGSSVEAVSVTACLLELEALVASTWESGIRVLLTADADLPPVTCSRVNLQNAVMNLLFNARDAMPSGGTIAVDATAIYNSQVAVEVEIRVADDGVGMTRETMLRAVEPFFTTKTTGLGGLGLPMVRRFMHEAGGRLDIDSEPGVGTAVTLHLPVSAPRPQRQSASRRGT